MKLGLLSDTHELTVDVISAIVADFKSRGVDLIIHCGDLHIEHAKAEVFGHLPVIVALVDDEAFDDRFRHLPDNWEVTTSGHRVKTLSDGTVIYVGHKLHMDLIRLRGDKFNDLLSELSDKYDGLRWVFGGHLHHRVLHHGHVSFVNPGAAVGSLYDSHCHEFAIVDTTTRQVTFSSVTSEKDTRSAVNLGIVADTLDVSQRRPTFWSNLVKRFVRAEVNSVVICGNIDLPDLNRDELDDFDVFFALHSSQFSQFGLWRESNELKPNWFLIEDDSIGDCGGCLDIKNGNDVFHLYVGPAFGNILAHSNEQGIYAAAAEITATHPDVHYILGGLSGPATFFEGEALIIDPGNASHSGEFAILKLPQEEFVFDSL